MAKGYTQTPGIDYEETFSPVADIRAIRILIAIAAYYDYEIWQMGYQNCIPQLISHEKLRLSKSQGASTPAELKRMQNVPYASAVGSIMYAVRCTRPDVAFAQNITSDSNRIQAIVVITWGSKPDISNLKLKFGINKWYQSIALRNFDLEDMEFESTNSGTTAKLPILKLVPQTTQENGTSVTKMFIHVTAEEKTNKKNDVKARGLLLMALPNEHQLTFSRYPDAKSMFAAIETRFGESLDSIFNRLQKIVSRFAILGMNKPEVETMSIDDLYNNFKIVEQKVKKSVGTSSGAQNLAFMTAPSTSSTNDANTASPQVCTASVSDNTVYAFMVENPNGSNVLHQDLEQIHEDDLEAMDLKWQLSLLSVRSTKKQGNNEDTSSKAMLAIDGVGFDWSDMAEEQVQTNMAQMAFSDSEVYTDKTCSKTCLKNYETLKKQCDDLIVKLNQTGFTSTTYKRGLATVEAQLITYRKNEVLFSEEIAVLKREVACKDYEINVLKSEFEKVKQEKDGIDFKIEKFDKASKDLDQLLRSQILDKSKKGLRYSAVPLPHPLIYNRPKKLDLSYSGLDEFKEPEFKGYGPENSKQESNVVCDKESENSKENSNESLVEEQVSQDKSGFVESSPNVEKEFFFPVNKKVDFTKPENHETPVKKSVSQDKYVAEILKKFNYSDVKSASTPVDLEKPLVKDGDADDVDVHLYRSMIGSLMYLTASRPDIMFAVCACARFQVTPKTSHLLAVKRIFRYLKGKPTLGLWYSRDSPFELVAYTNSDYAGATQDRKSTTGGSEYVAAASCCGQVLWIQNQLLDYGYNFMNTVINIDNNNLLTKGFDTGWFQYLVSSKRRILGKEWYWRMKILESVLSRMERMAGPKEYRVKGEEKEGTRKFHGSMMAVP
ncbi:putative ribonuclease H-like domain-containing protein [Tanacetum coccineum]